MSEVSSGESMPPALAAIQNQDRVQAFLARAVREGNVSHAYLFVGAPGSGMQQAAEALAQCLVCPQGGDGSCDDCIRVRHHTHPDVRWLAPQSVTGYLVAQVRDLIDDVQLAPSRGRAKVYVLDRAEQLRGAAANALLKTLEEPPAGVVFVLCARSSSAVLPTIVSRCQVVPFRVVAPHAAEEAVVRLAGVSEQDARIALAVAGTPSSAAEFLGDPGRRAVRRLVVRTLGELAQDDAWDVLVAAKDIVEAVRVPLADVRDAQKAESERNADFLTPAAMRKVEEANKRELSARERSGMMEALAAADSVLRDCLLRVEGVPGPIVNADAPEVVSHIADTADTPAVLRALEAVRQASDNLSHNVSPQLACEVMLCAIKEALS